MLARAKRKCKDLDFVRFSHADLNRQLAFPDDTFDRIVSVNVLYALKDPHFALREFSRILKPGGKIVVASPKPQFKVGTIVQDHFRRIGNVWGIPRRLFSITKTFILLPTMGLAPVLLNVFVIQKKGAKREYHFLPKDDLTAILRGNSFGDIALGDAYADQNWLARATRIENQTDVSA
jgi:ubiquinone/menaquinone biosynthesis C-methylase UbiE